MTGGGEGKTAVLFHASMGTAIFGARRSYGSVSKLGGGWAHFIIIELVTLKRIMPPTDK